ncbi:MAG: DUF4838 domain-containing protein [Lentisphaeria bacterium]
MKFHFLFILCIVLGVNSIQAALLDDTGKPYKEIVVAADAADSVKLAAKEFQKFTAELCKADLKIVPKATQFPVIFVGESPELEKRGMNAEKLPSEGYQIQTGDDFLAIFGRDYKGKPLLGPINPWRAVEVYNAELKLCAFGEAGTLTGVYEFLRKVGNVRFYLPGDLGTVVTPVENLKVPKIDIVGHPKANYRYPWFSMLANNPDGALWARRVGFGGKAPIMIIHSYSRFQKYRESHPEYFAMADGKRAFGSECVADGHGHLCLTNPAVIEQWAKNIIEYFEKNPQIDVYPLAPNDGLTRICECENCQKELRPEAGDSGIFSYHIWNFTQKVAALVAKRFPNKYVGCLAYEKYRSPPKEIAYMPNVAIMFCNWRSKLVNPIEEAKLHHEIEMWSKKVDRVYLWSWYLDHWLPWTNLPVVQTENIEKQLKYLFKNPKYCGEFIESEDQNQNFNKMQTPGMQHLNLYVTARLYWNANLNVDAVIDEYCQLFYGPAADPMRTFWLKAQKIRTEALKKSLNVSPGDVFTPAFIGELNALLKQGLDVAPKDSIYHKRVELIQKEFAAGAKRITRLSNIGIQKVAIQPHKNSEKLFAKVKPVKFLDKNGADYVPKTWFYTQYDRKFLYLKFICFEPEMTKLREKIIRNDDGAIWTDDSIEIFLCPDESKRAECYQLVINSNGFVFDGKVLNAAGRDPKWNSDAEIKVKKEGNRWIVEVRIPFASIGIRDPNFTGNLAGNFYRNRSQDATGISSCWSPTGVSAHYSPAKFGILTLEK